MRNKNQRGFTLIELLVVIAIIGLLASVVLLALNSARAKARDAKRLGDVRQLVSALELYYNDCNGYPVLATAATARTALGTSGTATVPSGAPASCTTGLLVPGYAGSIPDAPTPADTATCASGTSNSYMYSSTATTGASYTIIFCLGGQTGQIAPGMRTAGPTGIQ